MPEAPRPNGARPMKSQRGAHGGGNPFYQMAIRDAFEIQKNNQRANVQQKISTPKKG